MMNRRDLPRFTWLTAFEATARHLRVARAASELLISPAAVSQNIKQLEEFLDVELFVRTPHGLRLSSEGEAYLPVVGEVFDRLALGTEAIFGHTAVGTIHVRTTASFAALWLVPRLPDFAEAHPTIELRIQTDPGGAKDRKGQTVEIRYGSGDWPNKHVEPLSQETFFPVCSPWLVRGARLELTELISLRLLHVTGVREDWDRWFEAAEIIHPDAKRGLYFDSFMTAVEAAVAGLGVVLARSSLIQKHLQTGQLVAPVDLAVPVTERFHLVTLRSDSRDPVVTAFREWVLDQATSRDSLVPIATPGPKQ